MSKSCKYILLSALATASLMGCTQSKVKPQVPVITPEMYVERQLRDASESITRDLAILTGSPQKRDYSLDMHGDLSRPMDFVFDGPLRECLETFGARVGFKVVVVGKEPQVPPIVHVKMLQKNGLEIMRDIGMQTGKYEGVSVSEAMKLITLTYAEQNVKK